MSTLKEIEDNAQARRAGKPVKSKKKTKMAQPRPFFGDYQKLFELEQSNKFRSEKNRRRRMRKQNSRGRRSRESPQQEPDDD
jgi:hypothetical protein